MSALTPHAPLSESQVVGGCLCGKIRYALPRPPSDGLWCHCRICQRASGAPAVLWAEARRDEFKLTKGELRYYESSAWARRGFCAECGATIVYHGAPDGMEDFGIAAASLDDPNIVPVSAHIWTDSIRRGMILDPDLPRHSGETPAFESAREKMRREAK